MSQHVTVCGTMTTAISVLDAVLTVQNNNNPVFLML